MTRNPYVKIIHRYVGRRTWFRDVVLSDFIAKVLGDFKKALQNSVLEFSPFFKRLYGDQTEEEKAIIRVISNQKPIDMIEFAKSDYVVPAAA